MPEKKSWGGAGMENLKNKKENLRGNPLWINESRQLAAVWRAEPILGPGASIRDSVGPEGPAPRGGQRPPQAAGVSEACQKSKHKTKIGREQSEPKEMENTLAGSGPLPAHPQLVFIFDAGRR